MTVTTPPRPTSGPIATEKKTVSAMIRLYCVEHHDGAEPLCEHCAALARYSHARLDACPYGADKPTCLECPIHCYKPAEREAMREVMRFAGPRMVWQTPVARRRPPVEGAVPQNAAEREQAAGRAYNSRILTFLNQMA